MNEQTHNTDSQEDLHEQERQEFRVYVWGFGLALILTLLSFALVYWRVLALSSTLLLIGLFALIQILVHFRFFLHVGFRTNRDDLQLIIFSALLLIIMVTGTIWIMASLSARMSMGG